jgi:hypothetical protein
MNAAFEPSPFLNADHNDWVRGGTQGPRKISGLAVSSGKKTHTFYWDCQKDRL